MARDGAGEGVEVGGPAAAGFELVRRAVEGCVAGCAFLRRRSGLVGAWDTPFIWEEVRGKLACVGIIDGEMDRKIDR